MSITTDRNQASPHPPPWGILATVAWLLLAFLISIIVATVIFGAWRAAHPNPLTTTYDGVVISIGTMTSIPVQIAVLAFAAQLRHWRPAGYLGLQMPKRGEIIFVILCVVALDLAFDVLMYASGRDLVPPFQVEAYQSAKSAGWLLALTFAIVIVAPIGEEIAFRGFLYRGLARPGWEIYAIVVIALIWALLHIQYDWLGMAEIFAVGLMLGWFRWASGSTVLTIIMHVLINAEAMIETWVKMDVLS